MDCNYTTINTCELKGSTFRSHVLNFGDFDISGYEFSTDFTNALGQKIAAQTLEKYGNTVVLPLTALESKTGNIRADVWMSKDGVKDLAVRFDIVLSSNCTGCSGDTTTHDITITYEELVIPVTVTQSVVNINLDYAAADQAAENANEAAGNANTAAQNALSGVKGIATQSNAPTPYTPEAYPNGLFETYIVRTPLTMPNSWGSAVTQLELDNNFVYFDVKNGVVSKVLSAKIAGKSAYELAVINGFVGTEAQWLDSVALLPFENNFNATVEKVTSVKVYGDNSQAYSLTANPADFVLIYKAAATEKLTRLKLKIKTAGVFTVIKYNSTTATKTVLANYTVGVGDFEFLLNTNLAVNEYLGFENTSTAKIYLRTLAGSVYWVGTALTPTNSTQFSIELYKTSLTNPTFQTVISGDIDKTKLNVKINELIADKNIKLLSRDITSIEYSFNTSGSGTGAVYGFKTDKTTIVRLLRVKAGAAGIMRFVAYKPAEGGNPSDTINLASAVPIVVGFNIIDVDATIPSGYYIGTISSDSSAELRAISTGQGMQKYWQGLTTVVEVVGDYAVEVWEKNTTEPTLKNIKYKPKREFGVNAFDYGVKGDGLNDDTTAIQLAIDDLRRNGGGAIFFPKGVYKILGNLLVDEYPIASGTQVPIRLVGEGMNSTGKLAYKRGSTIFQVYAETGQANIYTRGTGFLGIEGITFEQKLGAIPFIKTMYTTIHVKGCAFISEYRARLTCDKDAIILGGEVEYEGNAITDNGGFQGYGTVIRDNHFNGIRRAVYGKVFANAVSVCDNSVWNKAGSNIVGGAAFEFDNVDTNGIQHNGGGMISGNLVELTGYYYAFKLGNTIGFSLIGNNCYDPHTQTLGCYYLGAKSTKNTVLPGFSPITGSGYGAIPLIVDVSTAKDNRLVQGTLIP